MCPTHLAAVVMRIASKRRFSLANLRPEFTTARRLTLPEIRISYRLVFYIPPPHHSISPSPSLFPSLYLPPSPSPTSEDEIDSFSILRTYRGTYTFGGACRVKVATNRKEMNA